jgi:hypothetical protein
MKNAGTARFPFLANLEKMPADGKSIRMSFQKWYTTTHKASRPLILVNAGI